MSALLDVRGVSKRFGGLLAVSDVSFTLEEGQILGLIGPNGAGKTTLFNVVNGVYKADGGTISFLGKDITGDSPDKVVHLGLARTHQIVKPLNDLSLLDNVTVGACFGREYLDLKAARAVALEVLKQVGLADRADMMARSLTIAGKKRLEVARALAAKPKLLLLDEVLAGLNPTEVALMIDLVKKYPRRRGFGVHDRAPDAGHHESFRPHRGAQPGPQAGGRPARRSGAQSRRGGSLSGLPGHRGQADEDGLMELALQLESIESGYGEVQVLWGISLEVARGKMTTIIGTNGAGKTTTLRAIMGSLRAWKGRVLLQGEDVTRLSPHSKANRGLVLVPEGRQLFPDMSVEENLEMGGYSRRARKRAKDNLDRVYELFPRLKERRKQKSSTLSGGEQQMLAMGRGLMQEPVVLMIDELSLGLAPVLAQQLFLTLKTLRGQGLTIVLVEQNVHLALAMSDYTYVFAEGRIHIHGQSDEVAKMDEVRKAYLGL